MMLTSSILNALVGGVIIGLAVTIMLFLNGRVTGISGIIASALSKPTKFDLWRWTFIGGMIFGGYIVNRYRPEMFANTTSTGLSLLIVAGVLVGYGTVMGSGCTSGHGICGISRLSVRSMFATITFMIFGFLSVQLVKYLLGGM